MHFGAEIAILLTAYPFFRDYELAEQLCDAAKESMCAEKNPSSWLDCVILHGEQVPTLEQIRSLFQDNLKNIYIGDKKLFYVMTDTRNAKLPYEKQKFLSVGKTLFSEIDFDESKFL